jgi:hypothetical protein
MDIFKIKHIKLNEIPYLLLAILQKIHSLQSYTSTLFLVALTLKHGACVKRFVSLQFFLILVCEAIGTAATPGLLCQLRVIVKMIVENQMECRLAGETEVLGRNPAPAPLLSITKSHMTRPGFEPGPPRWEAGD